MGGASLLEMKSALGSQFEGDSGDRDAELQRALDAAWSWITGPEGCNRSFDLDTEDQIKIYRPYRDGRIEVVDLVTVTSIALDTVGDRTYATTLTTDDYILWPYNEPRYSEIRSWPSGSNQILKGQLVRVVGRWGYVENGATPSRVKLAHLYLATRYFTRHASPFGILEVGEAGTIARIGKDPDIESLLSTYRADTLAMVV